MTSSSNMVYHVTERKHLKSIMLKGLEPRIGKRSAEMGEQVPRVYLFGNLDACEDALTGWLGECYADLDEGDLIILEISSDGLVLGSDIGWEIHCLDRVPAKHILRILDENLNVLIHEPETFKKPRPLKRSDYVDGYSK